MPKTEAIGRLPERRYTLSNPIAQDNNLPTI